MASGLGWKRLDHISIAVPDADRAVALYRKLFGLTESRRVASESDGYRGAVLDMPGDQGQIEILEPYGDGSFLQKFLDERGSGVHHIAIEVEDVAQAAAYLREEIGIEPFRGVESDGEWKQTFIHPRDSGGVLYQLFEWEPGHGPLASG